MSKHDMPPPQTVRSNAPQPVRTLRDWLDHLAARDRLAVLKPNIGLKFEIAAYAKRLDGLRATVFPKPDGHPIPVVSGLVSDRSWMAEHAVGGGEAIRRPFSITVASNGLPPSGPGGRAGHMASRTEMPSSKKR